MLGEAAIGIRRSRRPARAERAGASESAAGLRSETTSVVENQSGAVVQQRRRRDLAVDTIIPKPIFRFLISALYAFSAVKSAPFSNCVVTSEEVPLRDWAGTTCRQKAGEVKAFPHALTDIFNRPTFLSGG